MIQNCNNRIISTIFGVKIQMFRTKHFFSKFYIDFMDQKLILTPVCSNSSNKKISLRPRKSSVFAVLKITFLHSLPIPIAVINKEISNRIFRAHFIFYSRVSNKRVYTRTCILAKFPLYTALLDTYTTPCKSKTWRANFF